jgi:uncharacterized CHY-type Zn-finger protein
MSSILRSISILLMYLRIFNGSFCTWFILHELYYHSEFRTSLNVLIVTIFTTDCIRALICAAFESYGLIKTWNTTIMNCQEEINMIQYDIIIINVCRLTMLNVKLWTHHIHCKYQKNRISPSRQAKGSLYFNLVGLA